MLNGLRRPESPRFVDPILNLVFRHAEHFARAAAFGAALHGGSQTVVDLCVERFESAWRSGTTPAIDKYLPSDESHRHAALVELVHVDLEIRLKGGLTTRVEQYLATYPELAEDRIAAVDLIAAEFNFRGRNEPKLQAAEFFQRFPALQKELRGLFQSASETETWGNADSLGSTLSRSGSVRCPQCQHQIDTGDETIGYTVHCPACGTEFPHAAQSGVAQPAALDTGQPPRLLAHFELLAPLGAGAFGTVWKARAT